MKAPIFSVDRLSMSFGGLIAFADVSFDLQAGEALGFMGPNGAGKTTLINVVSGELKPDSGTVKFEGKDITGLRPHQICRLGIGRVYQIPQPFLSLTILQNILVCAMYGGGMSKKQAEAQALEIVELVGLADKKDWPAGRLEEISLKRLELARALASSPKLLLIDEMAGGLTEKEIPVLLEILNKIRSRGTTILLIEHVMKVLVSVVDRIFVMDSGCKIAEGKPEEIMANPMVIEAYFGSDEAEVRQ